MNIGIPRYLIVGMAALFSGYHVVLGVYSINIPRHEAPVIAAMALYLFATAVSLVPWRSRRMPLWLGVFNLAVVIALPLIVNNELDAGRAGGNGYATWYVAAVGTLMTITSTRHRHTIAWIGVGSLIVQVILWGGVGAVAGVGVIGSISWVAVAHILSSAMAKASKDAMRFAIAEREATDWQAAQEAHVFERQFRLGQTSSMALVMLRQIEASGGELTDEQRRECLLLEGAIRDEIRGRKLLNDAVRVEVMTARRRGSTVTLLDEGGIDDLSESDLDRVLTALAAAIRGTTADKVIARTVPEGSAIAVTVVGLRSTDDGSTSALGQNAYGDDEDEIDVWLEIPRAIGASAQF